MEQVLQCDFLVTKLHLLFKFLGPTADKQNVFPFGTPYSQILSTLTLQDPILYTQNGLIKMLERNKNIKNAPQKFQECQIPFELVITCRITII